MNSKFSVALLWLLVISLIAFNGWQYLHHQQRLETDSAAKAILEARLEEVQLQLTATRQHVETLERGSMKGIIREANDAILSGWENLVNTVEQEIKKARDDLQQADSQDQPQVPAAEPAEEKPDAPQ